MVRTADRPIALVGLMGSGKSVVARVLGERLGVAVADLDSMIETAAGCTIAELFEREGESAFRRREGELLEQALAAGATVIACGGGIVLDPVRRARLRAACRTVWLEVSPKTAAARVAATLAKRPLLRGAPPEERLAALLAERAPLYAETAEARVATDGRDPETVAAAVLAALGGLAR
ncbi:MAG: AAA family ATPase [Candidatus Eisenbacteria bacterium]|nr:AAA family ATPase [Candidatus Eisenbacteria bacterium]